MHTVIITDPNIMSDFEFDYYRHFFSPFLTERGGSVCYCKWNKNEKKLEEAFIPKLYDVIKGHPEWRAVVLTKSPSQDELVDPDNPFDFKCNHFKKQKDGSYNEKEEIPEGDLFLKQNEAPLVQLTHMLAGFPMLGVKTYDTGYVWYNEEIKKYETCVDSKGNPIRESRFDDKVGSKKNYDEFVKKYNEYSNKCNQNKQPKEIEHIKKLCNNDKILIKHAVDCHNNVKPHNLDDYLALCKDEARNKLRDAVTKIYGSKIKIKLDEIDYEEEEKEDYKKLTKMYAFKENRPVEVLLLSIRELQEEADDREKTCEKIEKSWEFFDESQSSDFWKIYPNTCRFLCYDIVNKNHTLYTCERWRFFLLTLTLAINRIPPQSLQAYGLYNIDLQIDTKELGRVYSEYLDKLLSLKDIISERISRIPELTQEKKVELVPEQCISVDFGQVEETTVKAKSDKFGFATDCPENEALVWHKHLKDSRQAVENILFAPQEIAAEKAQETRAKIESFLGNEQVLDVFQKAHIIRRIDEIEPDVINTNLYGMLDTKKYKAEVAKAGEEVRKHIKYRLTKIKILLISLTSLFVYLCGYIPYLINSAKISMPVLGWSSILVIAALSILAGGALLAIIFLRSRLIRKIRTYNKDVFTIFNKIKESAKNFSEYFSNVCTYMYARSLLSGVILKKNRTLTLAEIYKEHLNRIEKELDEYKKLCKMYNAPLNLSEIGGYFPDISDELLGKMPSECYFYEIDKFTEKGTVKLTSCKNDKPARKFLTHKENDHWEQHDTGITLDAPYSFITGINIIREEIYKKEGM